MVKKYKDVIDIHGSITDQRWQQQLVEPGMVFSSARRNDLEIYSRERSA